MIISLPVDGGKYYLQFDSSKGNIIAQIIESSGVTQSNKLEAIKSLLSAGANIDEKSNDGRTPLFSAVGFLYRETLEIAKFLLSKGASIYIKDNKGNTPLHHAAKAGNAQAVRLLLREGADPFVVNNGRERNIGYEEKITPLDYAKKRNYDERECDFDETIGILLRAEQELLIPKIKQFFDEKAFIEKEFITGKGIYDDEAINIVKDINWLEIIMDVPNAFSSSPSSPPSLPDPSSSFLSHIPTTLSSSVKISEKSSQKHTLHGQKGWVLSVTFSPDGNILAMGCSDNAVQLWDVKNGLMLRSLENPKQYRSFESVAFSPRGNMLVATNTYSVVSWDVNSGRELRTFKKKNADCQSVAFSPDGKILAASQDKKVILWDVEGGQTLKILKKDTTTVKSLVFSPIGNILAVGSLFSVKLWDIKNSQILRTTDKDNDQIYSVDSIAFSPKGNILAIGGYGKISLLDIENNCLLHTLEEHSKPICSVTFSPDGTILATGNYDKKARLWDVKSKCLLHTLEEHTESITSVAFSPDGTTLATGSEDKTVKLWDIDVLLKKDEKDVESMSEKPLIKKQKTKKPSFIMPISKMEIIIAALRDTRKYICLVALIILNSIEDISGTIKETDIPNILCNLLSDKNKLFRNYATVILYKSGYANEVSWEIKKTFLEDFNDGPPTHTQKTPHDNFSNDVNDISILIIKELIELEHPCANEVLYDILQNSKNQKLKKYIISKLENVENQQVAAYLLARTFNIENDEIRHSIDATLKKLKGTEEAFQNILLMEDADKQLKKTIIWKIGEFKFKNLIPLLTNFLDDKELGGDAAVALFKNKYHPSNQEEDLEIKRRIIENDNAFLPSKLRKRFLEDVCTLDSTTAYDFIYIALTKAHPVFDNKDAIEQICNLTDPNVVDMLLRLLNEKSIRIENKGIIVEKLGDIGNSRAVAASLCGLLKEYTDDQDCSKRCATNVVTYIETIAIALDKIGDISAIPQILNACVRFRYIKPANRTLFEVIGNLGTKPQVSIEQKKEIERLLIDFSLDDKKQRGSYNLGIWSSNPKDFPRAECNNTIEKIRRSIPHHRCTLM